MNNSTDIFKLIMICVVIGWSMYHFHGRVDDSMVYGDGYLKRKGQIINNLNQGVWIWYHKNGNVQVKGEFVDGKREGVWETYDSTGRLIIESTYKKNLLNGIFRQYSDNGQLIREDLYKDDTIVSKVKNIKK